ncbi:MAG TPA: PIN domain-containing protein [candidate division Zixibacteria bacterium]|nr:PIN domain-containing protein [candidate division Zixibacteria bacterium]
MRIYLDVCCLNRPFDDQTQDMVHLEAEAILAILQNCEDEDWQLVNSEIIKFEISKTPNIIRKQKVTKIMELAKEYIILDEKIIMRAKSIEQQGIKAIDSLHLASAEKVNVDVFLSTDKELIKKIQKRKIMKIKVDNPVKWLVEVLDNVK